MTWNSLMLAFELIQKHNIEVNIVLEVSHYPYSYYHQPYQIR